MPLRCAFYVYLCQNQLNIVCKDNNLFYNYIYLEICLLSTTVIVLAVRRQFFKILTSSNLVLQESWQFFDKPKYVCYVCV
jgi:hypothetical protein